MLYLPHSSHGATGHAAGAPTSDVGWEASRRRAQAIGSKGRRPPPRAPRAQRPESGTRHSAGIAGTPLATRGATLPRRPMRTGEGLARRLARIALLGAARPSAPARGGGRWLRAFARASGIGHSHREGRESGPGAAWSRLQRQVSRARAADAARGQKRPCLRASELGETHTRRTRARCMLVCPVVRRVADSD